MPPQTTNLFLLEDLDDVGRTRELAGSDLDADGDPQYDHLEAQLAEGPLIGVPAITLEVDANGAPNPDATSYAKKFPGEYAHRIIEGGVGHNLPQEAPQAFAEAVVEVDGY